MRKLFSLIAALLMTATAMAQHGAMTFAGKSLFYVTMGGQTMGNTTTESDTIVYSGADFVLPSMKYNDMVIPSFTIKNTTFAGGYDGVTWDDQQWTATAVDASGTVKNFTGTSLTGAFTHADGVYKLVLSITFMYGNMPMPVTYTIEGYYVKPTVKPVSVVVGGSYGPYTNDNVTYDARLYVEEGVKKLDVTMHQHTLPATVIGDLTLGAYTVKGLAYDEAQGGYYRDYSSDGIGFDFASTTGISGYYVFSKLGNLLVKMDGTGIAYAVNNFQPGVMPFPIQAQFGVDEETSIATVTTTSATSPRKYIANGRLVIERHGRHYNVAGVVVK